MYRTLCFFIVLLVSMSGCARFLGIDQKTEFGGVKKHHAELKADVILTPDQFTRYKLWRSADIVHLTAEEATAVAEFRQNYDPSTLSSTDRQFFADNPWLNPKQLSRRDIVYIVVVFPQEAVAAKRVAS